MGFLIVSEGGDGLGLALRLLAEGHKTTMWIRDPEAESRGEGLVEKGLAPDFLPIVVADCTGAGALLDTYRDAGSLTFGGSQLADRLECDRDYASEIFKACSIEQPDSWDFDSWEDAFGFLEGKDDKTRFVFKPEGKYSGNIPSFVAKDVDDLVSAMTYFKGLIGEDEPKFVLQEFVEGVCISSEGWYQKGRFVEGSCNHTLERKQLMNEDIGPSGGCTGNVVWPCDEEGCPLCGSVRKLDGFLAEHEYTGPVDINSVVTKDGEIYALEFTPRFGYDAFPTLLYGLFEGNFGSFIYDCARGDFSGQMPLRQGFAAGVRITTPPWPSEEFHAKSGVAIGGLRRKDFVNFYSYEVSVDSEDEIKTSGGFGIIGVCTAFSPVGITEAFDEAYRLVKRIDVVDKQYRTDLALVFESEARKIARAMRQLVTS